MQVAREGEMIGEVLVRVQVQGSGLTQMGLEGGRIRGTGRESRGRRKGERRGEEGGRDGASVAFAETNETLLVL